ncbi:MAG: AAA family ATPase, partial [Patescibacteria group bacterium]
MPWNRNKQIERVVRWHRRLPKGFVYGLRNVAGWLALGALIFNLILSSRAGLGVFLIAGGVWAAAGAWKKFFEWYKNPPLGASLAVLAERIRPLNAAKIFPLFDFNARQILWQLAKGGELSRTQVLVAIGTSHLLNFFFARTGISRDEYLSAARPSVPERPFSPEETNAFFEKALSAAIGHGHEFIRPVDILAVLFDEMPAFANLLRNAGMKAEDLDHLYHWEAYQLSHRRRSWTNGLTRGGIGKTWTYGYTPTLDRFAEELQVSSELEALHVQAHGREIIELENALSKHAAANAVLVGEPGVGAMTTVLGFAARVGEGRSVRHLNFKRVLKLNLDAVLSERRERILEVLGRILREAELAGNVILVIDSVHLYLTPGATDPNIVEVLLPYLKSTPVHFIGLTTPGSYRRSVLTQSIIATLFERIDVNEPDRKTMIRILEDYVTHREGSFGVTVRYQAIVKTVDLAAEYMVDKLFPAKGLELLEEALIEVSRRGGERVLKPEDVEAMLRSRLAVPVGEPSESEKKVLLRLEEVIHERVINQNEAVAAVADAMRRARAGITSREKPIGTFLFLGPRGVGKSETAKAVAQAYFGSAESMIRLDMS